MCVCTALSTTMFMIEGLAVILTCIFLQQEVKSADISTNILNFMTFYNGVWHNRAQVEAYPSDFDFVQVRLIPVKVPALGDVPVMFFEKASNSVVIMFEVGVLNEDDDGNIIVTPYFFAEPSQQTFGVYNVSNLVNLTRQDFTTTEECSSVFRFVRSVVLLGAWQDCPVVINGKRPVYNLAVECDHGKAVIPQGVKEKASQQPYLFIRDGDRFPLPDAPAGYVSPCGRSS